ncbi:MAG TPA: M48 family metallopeptidase [Polyangia bacterium]|nr:M48 family metallopeptidase [Polyangia bacterium]
MPSFDFDFQRYVARRKGAREAEVREGAAYAYAGDLKVLRTLDRLRPVTLALEAAVRLWRTRARAELLGTAIRVHEKQFPEVHRAATHAAATLHVAVPTVYVSPRLAAGAYTFGTADEAAIVIDAALVTALAPRELDFVIGRECGHLQNGHVPFRTTLYLLQHFDDTFMRWIVTPAVAALGAWSRRAAVTADRAGLLCMRDVDAACAALVKATLPESRPDVTVDDEAYQMVARREAALRVFAESAYYCGVTGEAGGQPAETCDARVAEILGKGTGSRGAAAEPPGETTPPADPHGSPGASGSPGTTGTSGTSGTTGTPGASDPSGTTGPNGTNGTRR